MKFVIKAHIVDASSPKFEFGEAKTMYAGKTIAPGDTAFLFASENHGGCGLIARGCITEVKALPRTAGPARQTPRVSVAVERTAVSHRPLGRAQLKPFSDWNDGRPQTELNFKLYRQATDKIVGISDQAADFLESFFCPP